MILSYSLRMFRCYTAVSQTRFTFRYTSTVFDKLRGATARPCGISTELSGAITTEFNQSINQNEFI